MVLRNSGSTDICLPQKVNCSFTPRNGFIQVASVLAFPHCPTQIGPLPWFFSIPPSPACLPSPFSTPESKSKDNVTKAPLPGDCAQALPLGSTSSSGAGVGGWGAVRAKGGWVRSYLLPPHFGSRFWPWVHPSRAAPPARGPCSAAPALTGLRRHFSLCHFSRCCPTPVSVSSLTFLPLSHLNGILFFVRIPRRAPRLVAVLTL